MFTCNAYGILPPVSKLTPELASYYFLAGRLYLVNSWYRRRAPFIVLRPSRYAEMLADRKQLRSLREPLARRHWIVNATHSGKLLEAEYETVDDFNLSISTHIEGVPREILNPSIAWVDRNAFTREVRRLGAMFTTAIALHLRDVDENPRMAGS
ncbi:Protein kinase C-like 1 [Serendipita sp. 400]|nr:Protein kinase C-like 1 [Serendipita sp. 400]